MPTTPEPSPEPIPDPIPDPSDDDEWDTDSNDDGDDGDDWYAEDHCWNLTKRRQCNKDRWPVDSNTRACVWHQGHCRPIRNRLHDVFMKWLNKNWGQKTVERL